MPYHARLVSSNLVHDFALRLLALHVVEAASEVVDALLNTILVLVQRKLGPTLPWLDNHRRFALTLLPWLHLRMHLLFGRAGNRGSHGLRRLL